jgi:putative nucleotidyltransferase with HDIG domain
MFPIFTRLSELFQERVVKRVVQNWFFRNLVFALILFVAVYFVLIINVLPGKVDVQLGEESKMDIKAPRTVENRVKTEDLRKEAGLRIVAEAPGLDEYYRISTTTAINVTETVKVIFKEMKTLVAKQEQLGGQYLESDVAAFVMMLENDYGIRIPRAFIDSMLDLSVSDIETIEGSVVDLISNSMRNERISSDNLDSKLSGILAKAEQLGMPDGAVPFMTELISQSIKPNLVLDEQMVEHKREEAEKAVNPELIHKGQLIVARGEIVTAEHIEILKDLGLFGEGMRYSVLAGMALLVFVLFVLVTIFIYRQDKEVLKNQKLIALFGLISLVTIGLMKLFNVIFILLGTDWIGYLVPVAFGTVLVTVLVNPRMGIILSVVLACIAGIIWDGNIVMFLVTLAGGLAGVFSISEVSHRSDLIRAGLWVGLANVGTITSLGLLYNDGLSAILLHDILGIVNGLVSSILSIGCLPFLEHIFGLTSSVRLLEISNPNHPLLKQMLLSAPGTYHHSIMVGNLAEAAVEAIGANTVVARVGAYYHDVGKIKRPYFFTENQFANDNPHDKITPSLSTLIITSHVKDGLELARQYKLPEPIQDIIQQHHGTTTVSCFYHRAVSENGEEVDEAEYKYNGPKPQTREAAMVMLADAVEAAVRSLSQPTTGKIEGLVRKIIKERLNAGEFDECDITLRDLDLAANGFVNVLTGIFHSRVEYPEGFIKEAEKRKAE